MLLSEAKEILKKNGYHLKTLNENNSTFKQWYTAVADEIEKYGYDEVILSDAMEDDNMSKTIIDMYDDGIEPIQAASEVIDWTDSKKCRKIYY